MERNKLTDIKFVFCPIYAVYQTKLAYNAHGVVAAFEIRQCVTDAKFINKSSFIMMHGVIRRLELKPISDL